MNGLRPLRVRPQVMPSGLSIERSDDEHGVVLSLSGELDAITAPELEGRLGEIMTASSGRVLLDLRDLKFVDSAGVSVLIKAKNESEASGRELVLRRPTAQVHDVFAVVGLVEWLTFEGVG